jgi:hypothetical protein
MFVLCRDNTVECDAGRAKRAHLRAGRPIRGARAMSVGTEGPVLVTGCAGFIGMHCRSRC